MRAEPVPLLSGALLVGLLLTAGAAAAAPAAHLEVQVPGTPAAVGDRVPVTVQAVGDSALVWGDLQVDVGDGGQWAVASPPAAVPGSDPPAWRLVLQPLAVGSLALPPLHVTVRDADGTPHRVDPHAPPTVTVASVLPPGEKVKPAALHDPVGVTGFPWEWVLPAAGVLLPLLALLWWGLRRWRRRRLSDDASALQLPPLPELEALLGVVAAAVGREPAERLCDRLAAGLRRYLGRSCAVPAMEMTSFELRLLGRRLAWPEEVQRGVQAVLAVVDGVRFGRRMVPEAELSAAVDRTGVVARLLADHLRPVEDEAVEAAQ